MPLQKVFRLDVDIKNKSYMNAIELTANDSNVFIINLFDDGKPFNLTDVTTISIAHTRLDKQSVVKDGTKTGENQVTFELGSTETAISGRVDAVVQLYNADDRVSTITFSYKVVADPTAQGFIPSTNEKTLIEVVLNDGPLRIQEAIEATAAANTATENANTAAANANTQANYATEQGNYAKSQGDSVKGTVDTMNARLDNLVTNTGDSTTEIVDGRLGADNVARANIGALIREVHGQQINSNQQPQTLTQGVNVVNGDVASPLKVEFYGRTLVNLLGKHGNFDSLNWDGQNAVTPSLDSANTKYGTNALKLTLTSTSGYYRKSVNLQSGKYYIVIADIKNGNATKAYVNIANINGTNITGVNYQTSYVKYSSTQDQSVNLLLYVEGSANQYAFFDGVRVFEITKDTYDKIGVSISDSQVESMFPYVDSVQHVKNPVVKVEGENLWNTVLEFGSINSSGVLGSSTSFARSQNFIGVTPSTSYVFKDHTNTTQSGRWINFYDANQNNISQVSIQFGVPFTTPSNVRFMKYSFQQATPNIDAIIQLNIGTTLKPYVPYNSSYLYAETTLAGDSNKKDILFQDFSDSGKWKKQKVWETDVVLDGSLAWVFSQDYTGFKRVYVNFSNSADYIGYLQKYDGKPLLNQGNNATFTSGDAFVVWNDDKVFITINDTDSGWLDSMTTVSSDLIKSYFHGWKYTGDGTTHSWVSLVDGSAPSTNTLAYVSTNKAPNFTPYKLTYQLAKPVIEDLSTKVEGDLAIGGLAQAEVSAGIVNREKVTPYYNVSGNNLVYINDTTFPTTKLKNNVLSIIAIYKNEINDTHNWDILTDLAYGKSRARTKSGYKFDSTAEYTVSYEVLDKHAFTTNPTEVKVTYNKNVRTALDETVKKQSDLATDVSVNVRAIAELYKRVRTLEGV